MPTHRCGCLEVASILRKERCERDPVSIIVESKRLHDVMHLFLVSEGHEHLVSERTNFLFSLTRESGIYSHPYLVGYLRGREGTGDEREEEDFGIQLFVSERMG